MEALEKLWTYVFTEKCTDMRSMRMETSQFGGYDLNNIT